MFSEEVPGINESQVSSSTNYDNSSSVKNCNENSSQVKPDHNENANNVTNSSTQNKDALENKTVTPASVFSNVIRFSSCVFEDSNEANNYDYFVNNPDDGQNSSNDNDFVDEEKSETRKIFSGSKKDEKDSSIVSEWGVANGHKDSNGVESDDVNKPKANFIRSNDNQRKSTKKEAANPARTLVSASPLTSLAIANPTRAANKMTRANKSGQLSYLETVIMPSLWKQEHSWPFHKPVDPVKLNIPDYFDIVKEPIDLGTIKKRLNENVYDNGSEVVKDIDRMFKNCYLYNQPGDEIVEMAKSLEEVFVEKLKKLPDEEEENEVNDALGEVGRPKSQRANSYLAPLQRELRSVCRRGDVSHLQSLLTDHPDLKLDLLDEEGSNALNESVTKTAQFEGVTRLLLEAGADITVQDQMGNTPLHNAVLYYPSTEVTVKMLLERGADASARNFNGDTATSFTDDKELKKTLRELGKKKGKRRLLPNSSTGNMEDVKLDLCDKIICSPEMLESPIVVGAEEKVSTPSILKKRRRLADEEEKKKTLKVKPCDIDDNDNHDEERTKKRKRDCENDEEIGVKRRRIRFNEVDDVGMGIDPQFSEDEDDS